MSIERIFCALLIASGASPALASLIFAGPTTFSQNIGSFPTVLTMENQGTSSGCVGFAGGMDVMGLGACPGGFTGAGGNETGNSAHTGTRTIAELGSVGITNPSSLLFVFNSGEPAGHSITITDLAITFFDVNTDASFTAAFFGTPMTLTDTSAGSGTRAGFAFRLDSLQAAFASDFFSNTANRVGAAANITGSAGGLETFFFGASAPAGAVPEPATALLLGMGLVGVSIWSRRARSRG